MKSEGYVLYRGPSMLTGETILAVALPHSSNSKTGDVVSVFIIPCPDVVASNRPHASVCGDGCELRDKGACYIVWSWAPLSVQRTHGRKPVCDRRTAREVARGRVVRLGASGDPAAVPAHVWRNLTKLAHKTVGYTHEWRRKRFAFLRAWCMASVENGADMARAWRAGWRTYRVRPPETKLAELGEIQCPSNTGVQCSRCALCSGGTGLSVSIEAHGGAVAARESARIAVALR